MMALKAFVKPFEAPQKRVKIKISVNFYFNIKFLNAQDGKGFKVEEVVNRSPRSNLEK